MYSTREQIFYLQGVPHESGTREDNIVDISDKLRLYRRQSEGSEHSDPFCGHYEGDTLQSGFVFRTFVPVTS